MHEYKKIRFSLKSLAKTGLASEEIRSKYFGHCVTAYLTKGSQNPVAYVNA